MPARDERQAAMLPFCSSIHAPAHPRRGRLIPLVALLALALLPMLAVHAQGMHPSSSAMIYLALVRTPPVDYPIAFTSLRDGNNGIYVMHGNGGIPVRLTPTSTPSGFPTWSPDGRKI